MERELTILSGKVARDHIAHRPYQSVSQIVQWLKGISSRRYLEEAAGSRQDNRKSVRVFGSSNVRRIEFEVNRQRSAVRYLEEAAGSKYRIANCECRI